MINCQLSTSYLTANNSVAHTVGVIAKSITGIRTPQYTNGVKHALSSVFFCARRLQFNGRLGGPLRRAVSPLCTVVRTRSVDLPMIRTIGWSYDNTQRNTAMNDPIHCRCPHAPQRKPTPEDQAQIIHLADFTRVLANGVQWQRNDEEKLWVTVRTIITNQEEIRSLAGARYRHGY